MFQRFINTVRQFMMGRYGSDKLNGFLFIVYLLIWIVSAFFRGNQMAYLIFTLAMWAVLGLLLFRTLSRNIPRRQAENQRFLRIWTPIGRWLGHQWERLRDIRRYRYRTCPGCSARLRLPIKRGRRTVTCHRCRTQFKTFFL